MTNSPHESIAGKCYACGQQKSERQCWNCGHAPSLASSEPIKAFDISLGWADRIESVPTLWDAILVYGDMMSRLSNPQLGHRAEDALKRRIEECP